jgi:hypothetical protein
VQEGVVVPALRTGDWQCGVCLELAREEFAEADSVER